MSNEQAAQLTQQYLMSTYAQLPVAFVRGKGSRLWDADGKQYLDFVAGIAVLGTGHCHPHVSAAICEQAHTLMHTSNLYHIPQQGHLARKLVELSCAERVFFCNSGAEANESAIKLARKWAGQHRGPDCRDIITATQSFHGRTLATLTATGQEKVQKSFHPLPVGFKYVPFGDAAALQEAVDERTCAVMLEPIQAEGGINVPEPGYLSMAREMCDSRNMLLILDEVQTGMGRTGHWFGYMADGVEPDIFTLAKSLGGGFPIGACLARGDAAEAFEPGDHAATFGGNHLACIAALAVIETIEQEGLVQNAGAMGRYLADRVAELQADCPCLKGVRGRGLLAGVQLQSINGRELQQACLADGLVVNALGEDLLRIAPALTITEADIDEGLEIIVSAAARLSGQ